MGKGWKAKSRSKKRQQTWQQGGKKTKAEQDWQKFFKPFHKETQSGWEQVQQYKEAERKKLTKAIEAFGDGFKRMNEEMEGYYTTGSSWSNKTATHKFMGAAEEKEQAHSVIPEKGNAMVPNSFDHMVMLAVNPFGERVEFEEGQVMAVLYYLFQGMDEGDVKCDTRVMVRNDGQVELSLVLPATAGVKKAFNEGLGE